MDNMNKKVGGKKKKKRGEKNKNSKGELSAESAVGAMSFGEQGSDLGGNQELGTDYGVSSSGLSDVNEGLESQQGREEQGAQAIMEESSDAMGNAILSINNGLSKDGEAPTRFDDSGGFEEEGFKDCEAPVEGELEIDDVHLPSSSSGFNDDKDPSSAKGEGIGIDGFQDSTPAEEATVNSVASDMAKDVQNTSNAHEVISPKGITVEPADPAYESEQVSLSDGASHDSGAIMEEKSSSVGQLPFETQVNQVVGSSHLEMTVAEDKPSTYFSNGNSRGSVMDSLQYYRDERNRNSSVDESFVDALDRLSESRSTSLDGSTYAMDSGLLDKERLVIEIHACKNALEQANTEKTQLVFQLNSLQIEVEKLAEEKVNLEVKLQEAASVESGVKSDADGNNMLLLEQERLKQVIHSREQEISEMAKAVKEMETQLQAETKQRAHLSHQLEVTQQNLNELSEKKDALTKDLEAKATGIEDIIKQKVLLEEKLQTSKLEGEILVKNANQYCITLQQKVEDLEAEKAAALSKMMGVQRNVEVEAMNEAQDGPHCLEAQVERFAKEAKNREEKLRSELQILSDENHNLLTQLDGYGKNMMRTEHENQLVRNELAELKFIFDETNKAKEWITRDFENFKQGMCSEISAKEGFEAEVARLRQQIEELNSQLCHVKGEMDEVTDENLKLMREKSQFEATIGQLESSLFTKERDIQDTNARNVELSQKCDQFEDISAKCVDMVCQTTQLANERDSLLLEVDALQKSVLEKDMLVQASVDSHNDLKCQFDKVIENLIAHIEEVFQAEMLVADPSMQRISYLETSLFLLIEKYTVSLSQVNLLQTSLFELASSYGHLWEQELTMPLDVILREVFRCKEMELTELNERLDEMNLIRNQQEAEVGDLRYTLCQHEENHKEVKAENSKLRSDLDQAETRLSSVREKLSLAVTKGKGLVQQRDTLRQELMEKTNGLEKCLQELQLKNDALHEVEVKAAERLKSLESEVADVKISASAFQESLLHKEIILQKIKNILEEVNLPDVLHSKEITEKIEWLVRSSPGEDNTACLRDLKISELNETNITNYKSYETNVDNYLMDKRSLDDLKSKYDELQDNYCSLVEQSSLMEQSLLERNHLIQKWEEMLNSVHVPTTMESIEPASKIEWICRQLSEAQQDVTRFQHNIENVQKVVGSADVELEDSKMRISILEESLLKEKQEKEASVKNLEGLSGALSEAQQDVVRFQQEIKDIQRVVNSYAIELEESKMRINSSEESLKKEKQEKETLMKNLEELQGALSQAQLDAALFQHEIENVRRVADSSAIELEGSKTRISSLEETLSGEKQERETLVKNMEDLSRTLCQAQQDATHFQHEVENVQRVADSATIELEESKTKVNSLEEILMKGEQEKEDLEKSLEEIKHKYKILSEESVQDATQDGSCNELVDQHQEVQGLQSDIKSNVVDKSLHVENCMKRLVDIVNETMKDQDFEDLYGSSGEHLEGCVRKLIGKLNALSEEVKSIKETENLGAEELQSLLALLDITILTLTEMSKNQEETSSTVESHRAEINCLAEKNQIMSEELVMVKDQKDALKVQLEESEERSSLIREKLSIAVKKGRGLVQQRDSLKQSVDEKTAELEHLRAELQVLASALNEHQERISNLTSEMEHFKRLQADMDSSKNQCAELENLLLDSNSELQRLMDCVDAINFPGDVLSRNPIEKIEWLGKSVDQLYQNINSAEDEAKKFKGEVDIVVTKLDEACANVRTLEEELRVAENKILTLTNEKMAAEAESNREIQESKDVLAARTQELSDVHTSLDFQNSEFLKQYVSVNNLRKEHRSLLSLLASDFSKKLHTLRSMELYFHDILSQLDASKGSKISGAEPSNESTYVPMELHEEVKYLAEDAVLETYTEEYVDHLFHDDGSHKGKKVSQLLSYLERALNGCKGELELIKDKFGVYCNAVDEGTTILSQLLQHTREDVVTLVESLESLKKNVVNLEALKNDKDNEILMLGENITMMVNACKNAMEELQNLKVQIISDSSSSREEITTLSSTCSLDNSLVMQLPQHMNVMSTEYMKTAEKLLFTIKDLANTANENSKQYQREVSTLKVKLQQAESGEDEKSRICTELESKLTRVETLLNDITQESSVSKERIFDLESQIASMENDGHAFESRIKEFQTRETSMKVIQEEVASLHDVLSAKNQAFEKLHKKMQELENDCGQKQAALEDSESSRCKALAELSDSSIRFEELRQLSEGLISEVDNLHLQLESRGEEIARLKEEAIKSTYDIPAVLKNIEKKNQEVEDLQLGLENMIAKLGVDHMLLNQKEESRMQTMLRTLEDSIFAIISDYETFKADAQNKDALLRNTQNTVGELCGKVEMLEASLHEKQTHSEIFRMEKHPQPSVTATEVSEIEELGQSSKTTVASVAIAPHVRSTRKASSNHLALNIDTESENLISDSEDHDKGHAFKSMSSTGLIPKSSQSVADWVDGIWVSGGRMLMQQPTARMGLIVYWIAIHLWMVATVL